MEGRKILNFFKGDALKKVLIALLLTFSFSFAKDCSKYFLTKDYPLFEIVQSNKEYLELTMEQEEAILAAKEEFDPKISLRKEEIDKLEEELNKLILKGGSSSRIKEIIIKLAQLKAENEVLKIKQIRAIQNSLTESQYKRLLELLEENPI